VIGAGAELVDAHIGPFTAIGDGAAIERARVDHSVIMEGARIRDIPLLTDSLIGKRVVVQPGAPASGVSLMVGDDCVVNPTVSAATRRRGSRGRSRR
jgi:glucose-1-phosphate thymidylyltransferase